MSEPKSYRGIMVSSTFADLQGHRADEIEAIQKSGFRANVMEASGAQTNTDVIETSLQMVREGSDVERIYEVFNTSEEFAKNAAIAIGRLSKALPEDEESAQQDQADIPTDTTLDATAPDLRARPRYLGSHDFVGRQAELNALDDWSADADPNPMLLFEAIGGSGKSMVTWTWLTRHAMQARDDWAGRFWFSFYEGGATMSRFCREALAYMTNRPVEDFRKQHIRDLIPQLLTQLEARPWLMVLDGLERILVAYHRIDAPQMRDEDIDDARDQMSDRDPRAAINPDDEELLRLLTDVAPSKILVTSRLTPQALINKSDMPLPGVRREPLRGLRPADAESLFRACGVDGESQTIHTYLQTNCDCHPLVIGALAGLVNNYGPDRGNFDAWLADPQAGGKLGLADLDLTQRRNHILDAAIGALPDPDRKLLQALCLLQGGADYATLKEFNPHLPAKPKEPENPRDDFGKWFRLDSDAQEKAKANYEAALAAHADALAAWERNPDVSMAAARFDETLKQLERRGLLQYDHDMKCYDLHPVVRGVASGRMGEAETGEIGEQVVDHFSSRQHAPWEEAETLDDVADGIQTVATLTRMGEFERALNVYRGDLNHALLFNLSAKNEVLRLLRPFFPQGWDGPIALEKSRDQSWLISYVTMALHDEVEPALRLSERMLLLSLAEADVRNVRVSLTNLVALFTTSSKLASADLVPALALRMAEAINSDEDIFIALFSQYRFAQTVGEFERAEALWTRLDGMGRGWNRAAYRSGSAEYNRALDLFCRGQLAEADLANAEHLCRKGRNRVGECACLTLRGTWHLSRNEPGLAVQPLTDALRLYRESGSDDPQSEALLTLARMRAGHSVDAWDIAERLDDKEHHTIALHVAEIWKELGEPDRAVSTALRAHTSAIADGEPYVFRYYLDRADALLRELGETPPPVPKHDPASVKPFEWEGEVRALIEKTRQEREAREREEAERKKTSDD